MGAWRRFGSGARAAGVGWIAAAVAVAMWPGLTISGLAIFVGIVLVVGGVLRFLAGRRGDVDDRLIAVISGLARAIFGALAKADGWNTARTPATTTSASWPTPNRR